MRKASRDKLTFGEPSRELPSMMKFAAVNWR